jgi:hypothetical protein
MAVDPYVPAATADAPRSKEKVPPARGWKAVRPGDLPTQRPRGHLFGTPGPDAGYALALGERFRSALDLAWQEHPDDGLAVGTAIGMKRAALFGRAPILADIEVGLSVLGYLGGAPEDLVDWRRERVRDARHSYPVQRDIADAIAEATLRLKPAEVRAQLANWRTLIHA